MKKITTLKLLAIGAVSTLLTACSFQPNWYAAGRWNYTHKYYDQALPQLLWAAQLGNPSAEYAVGYMYYNGLGTPKDDVLAYHWFEKAVKQGNQRALYALNQMDGVVEQMDHRMVIHHHHHIHNTITKPSLHKKHKS